MKTSPARGSALIVTLAMLSLITILLVGFCASMRFDLISSHSHFSRTQAALYARMGLDAARTELANALGTTNAVWAGRPGRLTLFPTGADPQDIELSSGAAPTGADADAAADLNPRTFSGASDNLVASTNLPMRAAWIYVSRDGTFSTNAPAYAAANPVIGRFAFWVDDEGAKVNLNTAWTRGTANSDLLWSPSRVELSNLFGLLSAADPGLVRAERGRSPFNSLRDALRTGGGVTNAIAQDAFSLTRYSHGPDLNLFGQPRIQLTTHPDPAGGTNYLNILSSPGADPGYIANLNGAGVAAAVNLIYGYLTNAAWPVLPGASFANKYAPGNNFRAAQLAIDIVEYVRSAESTNPVVEPIRGTWTSAFQYSANAYDAKAFIGSARGPRFTEVGVYIPSLLATATNVPLTYKVEVYLPTGSGIASVDLTQYHLMTYAVDGIGKDLTPTKAVYVDKAIDATEAVPSTLASGHYSVITRTVDLIHQTSVLPPYARPTDLSLRLALKSGTTGAQVDIAPLQTAVNKAINYQLDPAGGDENSITSVQVDDPYVNKRTSDWVQGPNTFGAANRTTLGGAPGAYSPPQDTDSGGNLTDVGIVFPAPKGTAANPSGLVQSAAELGRVHSGIEESVAGIGAPWRTLRLQPRKSGSTDLPDWALVDLFSVPASALDPFVRPSLRCWGGRINVNATMEPFSDGSGRPLFARLGPLEALLLNATNAVSPSVTTLDPAAAAILASNIYYRVLSTNTTLGTVGSNYGTGAATNVYCAPAQLAEVAGISDNGEGSEALLREIAGLAATSGNVFSIYTLGQALQQDASGAVHVVGEARFRNIVERWDNGTSVVFRPVFSQALSP